MILPKALRDKNAAIGSKKVPAMMPSIKEKKLKGEKSLRLPKQIGKSQSVPRFETTNGQSRWQKKLNDLEASRDQASFEQ